MFINFATKSQEKLKPFNKALMNRRSTLDNAEEISDLPITYIERGKKIGSEEGRKKCK